MRTNPGLTTNVKIVVEKDYGLSLESIDSMPELSLSRYKKVVFNKSNYYDELIPYFYKGLPSSTAYHIKYDMDSDSMSTEFVDQFDEIYQYGAKNITNNKNYAEEYEYFAPLYIFRNKLPSNFIIFRVDGPGIVKLDKDNFKSEILDKMKVVSLFDLSKKTPLGEWLNINFNENEFFPDTPFEMSYDTLEFSKWNGIDFESGGYITKSLFMDDTLTNEQEIFEFEKLIFDGYLNNKIVFPNILNLNFLFDDTPADEYSLRKWSINRYYGFYLDSMDMVSSISPYMPPKLRTDVEIIEGNILNSPSGIPFLEGWSDDKVYYVELENKYYKVEKFIYEMKASVKKVETDTQNNFSLSKNKFGDVVSSNVIMEDIGNEIGGNYSTDEKTSTFVDKWRIISDADLSGKESMLNSNYGIIDSNNMILNENGSYHTIDDFERADVWVVEIDGVYHKLVKQGSGIKVNCDHKFEFGKDTYKYYVNKNNSAYTKTASFAVDSNNAPIYFPIYRIKFTDIKDFDTRIIETELSKFEYELKDEISETEETKLYFTDLNTETRPQLLDDYIYKNKVVNIPVSSEYTANQETFKVDFGEVSQLWRKNPVYCRWCYEGSLSAYDYPYCANNSDILENFNRTTDSFYHLPSRQSRNLDYFYTVNPPSNSYVFHSLHIQGNLGTDVDYDYKFDFDRYYGKTTYTDKTGTHSGEIDYFDSIFNQISIFENGLVQKKTRKYSEFLKGDVGTPNYTLFRGIKFSIYDVGNIKFNNGKIDVINTSIRNTFEDYKFSILLTSEDNGMIWDVIEEWSPKKNYKKNEIVISGGVLYRATTDTICQDLYITLAKNKSGGVEKVRTAPHNLMAQIANKDINAMTNIKGDVLTSGAGDWVLYSETKDDKIGNVFWQPQKMVEKSGRYNKFDVVYKDGNYFYLSNDMGKIDFWNPILAMRTIEVPEGSGRHIRLGYTKGVKVYYDKKFWTSDIDNNIYIPGEKFWSISESDFSNMKWSIINLWLPNKQYVGMSYVVYKDVLYANMNSSINIPSGTIPSNSSLWTRIYSFVADTDLIYTKTRNPYVYLNNSIYRMISNPGSSTLESGINIFINKKYKNILVNIYVNDNTIPNLKNTERDKLYNKTSNTLIASNFINCINDLSRKGGFSDYLKYIVIKENGEVSEYKFGDGLENLPFIIVAERPESLNVRIDSLEYLAVNQIKLKPGKVLIDSKISNTDQLNYYNGTNIGAEIIKTENNIVEYVNYGNTINIKDNKIYRFGGNYMPLFYEVELFNSDNPVFYNVIDLSFELSTTQNVTLTIGMNGSFTEQSITLYPSASYSTSLEYLKQVSDELELAVTGIDFHYKVRDKFSNVIKGSVFKLEEGYFNTELGIWFDTAGEGYAELVITSNTPKKKKTDLYPGEYIEIYGGSSAKSLMVTNKILLDSLSRSYEFIVKSNDVQSYRVFVGDGQTLFGFEAGRAFMTTKFESSTGNLLDGSVYSEPILEVDVWYHLLFRVTDKNGITTLEVYVDGRNQTTDDSTSLTHINTTNVAGKSITSETKFTIGGPLDFTNLDTIPTSVLNGAIHSIRFYERAITNEEIIESFQNGHKGLQIKYPASAGYVTIGLMQVYPKLTMDIYDAFDPSVNTYNLQLGATGGNPPYEFSVDGAAFSITDYYLGKQKGVATNVIVKDVLGLTANNGYYTVNTIQEKKYNINGVFIYS
jgi:hypothetical protein